MKLLNIFNWVQSLVESFTFYGGAPSSGGGAMGGGGGMGGGRPSNPMQRMNPKFGGNPNMPQGKPGMPSMPQGMPQNPMFPGMGYPTQSQGSPMQLGFGQQPMGSTYGLGGQQFTPEMIDKMNQTKQMYQGQPPMQPQGMPMYQQRTPDSSTIFNAPQRGGGIYPGMGYPAQLSQQGMTQTQPSQSLQTLQGIMQGTPQY